MNEPSEPPTAWAPNQMQDLHMQNQHRTVPASVEMGSNDVLRESATAPRRSGARRHLVACQMHCVGGQRGTLELAARDMALTQTFQRQQSLNQQNYEFEQSRLLQVQQLHMDMARSMHPIQIERSGAIEVRVRK